MHSIDRIILLIFLCLLSNVISNGQSRTSSRRVYHLEKDDGSIYILADNQDTMPFTTLIRAKLVNMSSNVLLPLRLVVMPNEKTFVLAIFRPTGKGIYSWHYTSRSLPGIYTGHLPDTSYAYHLPYHPIADTIIPSRAKIKNSNNYFLYAFNLQKNTPICAARAGKVVAIEQQKKNSRISNANLVFVQHDDGSYASYENISRNSVIVQTGHQVAPGDIIGYFGENKRNTIFWFGVHYPSDSLSMTVPVKFQVNKKLIYPQEGAYSISVRP
jgi:hypothetical protein